MERLRSSRDITATLRGSRRCVRTLVAVHARTSSVQRATRIAVIASKKVGDAVRRNRAKRLLREAARRVPWTAGLDVVLVARPACAGSDLEHVRREVLGCARELGLVRQPA